jgi:hypothetical protein
MVWVEYGKVDWLPETGMYEPWDTWCLAHGTKEAAQADARSWAESEGYEYRGS